MVKIPVFESKIWHYAEDILLISSDLKCSILLITKIISLVSKHLAIGHIENKPAGQVYRNSDKCALPITNEWNENWLNQIYYPSSKVWNHLYSQYLIYEKHIYICRCKVYNATQDTKQKNMVLSLAHTSMEIYILQPSICGWKDFLFCNSFYIITLFHQHKLCLSDKTQRSGQC